MMLYHGGILWWLRREFCYVGWHTSDGVVKWGDSDNYYLPVESYERCRYCRKRLKVTECVFGPWDMMGGDHE